MYICPNCKETLQTSEPDKPRQFPALTIIGGVLGTAVGALTGGLLLVPLGIFAGAAMDVRRCGSCGRQIAEGEGGFRLMTEHQDSLGGRAYRPAAPQAPAASPPSAPGPSWASSPHPKAGQFVPSSGQQSLFTHSPRQTQPQAEFTFDEISGMLVQKQRSLDDELFPSDPQPAPPDAMGVGDGLPADILMGDVFSDPLFDLDRLENDVPADPIELPEPPAQEPPL